MEAGWRGSWELRSQTVEREGEKVLPGSTTWKITCFGTSVGSFLKANKRNRCVNSLLAVVQKPVF